MLRRIIIALVALFAGAPALAQTCENPIPLCGGQADQVLEFSPADLTGSPVSSCLQGDYLSVARFHTTFTNTTSGVTVNLSNVDCSSSALQVIVVLPNTLDFCDFSNFEAVSECITTSSDVTFVTDDLYVNTDYLVLICYQSGIVPSDCELQIEVSGEPLSIQACCPTNIDFQESADLEVLGGDPGVGYLWTPAEFVDNPTSYSVTVTPQYTTMFEVSGFVESCEYSDLVLVVVGTQIDVPNAFSPNGDNINDVWDITGLSSYTRSILTLYDRWGQQVLRSSAYPQPWDGSFNGQTVPAGTYYYVIELNEPGVNLEPLTGNVAVIR